MRKKDAKRLALLQYGAETTAITPTILNHLHNKTTRAAGPWFSLQVAKPIFRRFAKTPKSIPGRKLAWRLYTHNSNVSCNSKSESR